MQYAILSVTTKTEAIMGNFIYKTRGNASPQDKPKVYFACRPCDLHLFDAIADEILSYVDCAVYHAPGDDFDQDEHFHNLNEMNLFVLPVTTNLLMQDCYVTRVDIPFAKMNHIPILPLMQESGLDELFNQKCGDLQYLDKNARDNTAISYEDKLKNYLTAILVGDTLAEEIRAAFDAYIFLSYRKKDRKYAKELMELIHKNDFCRDIAIWYDEFLTPGENFNDTIAEALKKSKLFALAVTPNLVSEENYIMTVEYPMAKAAEKTVLPVELVPTDRAALANAYSGIRNAINSQNAEALRDALLDAFQWVMLRDNDDDPRHNFLIGLAYLSGIDVEKNPTRALDMITFAAERDLPEAIEKLVTMYENGEGVERDLHTAIKWQEKLVNHYQRAFENSGSEENAKSYIDALLSLGDAYFVLCDYKNTHATFQTALDTTLAVAERLNPSWALSYQAHCYDGLGQVEKSTENLNTAMRHYRNALEIREKIAETDESFDAKRSLWNSYIHYGDFHIAADALSEAYREYEKALSIATVMADTANTSETTHLLAITHIHIGNLLSHKDIGPGFAHIYGKVFLDRDPETANLLFAIQNYTKAKSLLERIQDYADNTEIKLEYTNIIGAIADIFLRTQSFTDAAPYVNDSHAKALQLFKKNDTYQTRRTLLYSYRRSAHLAKLQNRLDDAMHDYQEAFILAKRFCETLSTLESRYILATCYDDWGDVAFQKSEFSLAFQKYREALTVRELLARETSSLESRKALKESYKRLKELATAYGEYMLALYFMFADIKILLIGGDMRRGFAEYSYLNTWVHSDEKPNVYPTYLPEANDEDLLKELAMHDHLVLRMQGAEANYLGDVNSALDYYDQSIEALKAVLSKYPEGTLEKTLVQEYAWVATIAENHNRHTVALSYYQKELEAQKEIFKKSHEEKDFQRIYDIIIKLLNAAHNSGTDTVSIIEDYFTNTQDFYRKNKQAYLLDFILDAATFLAKAYREAKAPIFKRLVLAVKRCRYRAIKKNADRKHTKQPPTN